MFKSGFVTIIGRPNVGKSTFINTVLQTKIAIMSDKAQTTRNVIQGIYTDQEAQIVFIDTPGVHKPQNKLGSFMTSSALSMAYDVDVILFMANGDEEIGAGDRFILKRLKDMDAPVYLVLNKIDLLSKEEIYKKLEAWQQEFDFKEMIPISALKNNNIAALITCIKNELTEGPQYYPSNQVTDHPEQFIVSEIIREKLLYFTHEEIPHSIAINIDKMENVVGEDAIEVIASVICERQSQKGMIIGKQGAMIKKVKELSRKELKKILGAQVYLELYVRVEKDWRNKQKYLNEFGYNDQ